MRTFLIAAFATVTASSAMAQTMSPDALTFLDVNGDAEVSLDEFTGQMMVLFDGMDTNGNGRVEFSEVEEFIDRDRFDPADKNGNGVLSRTEFRDQMRLDFAKADKDGDGTLE